MLNNLAIYRTIIWVKIRVFWASAEQNMMQKSINKIFYYEIRNLRLRNTLETYTSRLAFFEVENRDFSSPCPPFVSQSQYNWVTTTQLL